MAGCSVANRYASIVRNVVSDIAGAMQKHLQQIPDATWTAKDGQLIAVVDGEELVLTFERDDDLTEALLLLLNNHALFLSALRNP
jgi:hypothetical protein